MNFKLQSAVAVYAAPVYCIAVCAAPVAMLAASGISAPVAVNTKPVALYAALVVA